MRRSTGKSAASRSAAAPWRINPVLLRGLLRYGGIAVLWGGSLAGIGYGLQRLDPLSRGWVPAQAVRLEFVGLSPVLANPVNQVLTELEAATGLRPNEDLYAPDLCERIAANLTNPANEASAWIAELRQVSKSISRDKGGLVRVEATFREPFAMVSDGTIAYVVDEAGVRLPRQIAVANVDTNAWFVIQGPAAAVPGVGEAWGGDDVAAGLKLAKFLRQAAAEGRLPFRSSLRALDVRNFSGRIDPRAGRLLILTIHPRSYIHWGRPPGEEYEIESTARRKLEMLTTEYVRLGQMPDRGPVDVRDKDGLNYEPPR